MSPDRSRTITAAKSPPAADSHTKRITTSPDLLPQTSLHWSSLNSCSFGSERRWYQPGQAADRAAALQQQALAAAAAERQVIDASQLLTAAPRSHSVTHQHSTFGSEPRFWEERSSLGTYVAQPEGQTSSSRQASPTQRRQQSPKGRHHHHSSHGVPQQSAGTSKKRYTFGLAPRWYEYSDQSSARQAHTTSPAPAPAQSATRDRVASVPPKAYSQPRSDVCASVQSNNSRRSISAGRSNAHQAGMPSSERSWWLSDSAAASNAVLRRIQEKHAHIQQLAAMISQQKSDSGQQHKRGRCHTVKAPSKPTHVLQSQAEPSPAQGFAPEPSMQSMLSVHASLPGQPVGGSSLQQPAHLLTPGHAPSAIMPSSDLLSEVAQDSQSGGSDQAELSAAIRQQQSLSRLPKDQPAHVSSLGDYVTTSSIMHSRSDASVPLHLPNDGSPGVAPQDMNPTASSTWPRGEHDTFGSPSAKTTLGRSQTFNSSRSVSPTWRRTASISDRSGLQEDLRNRYVLA